MQAKEPVSGSRIGGPGLGNDDEATQLANEEDTVFAWIQNRLRLWAAIVILSALCTTLYNKDSNKGNDGVEVEDDN